ncbi:hypothetical protein IscW_ISCW010846 [Ixodes scapularis]|uniref:Uncharacterized protein n=1 Tax=Ixodes scapularis TaxID=6945 RepID=B7Q4H3_IXOSC|nr:hypothetical protein IscW_ISCW010846 [Ixodes scapularis]|eukprot:XP_002400510.1 hypothetical protein IscW_ISCW010846 [Ixodes scapularis]
MAAHTKGCTALVKKLPASIVCKADKLTALTSSTREPKTAVRRCACCKPWHSDSKRVLAHISATATGTPC